MKARDTAWLKDVRKPGPNGARFDHPVVAKLSLRLAAADNSIIMEDDTTTSLFTPGCAAYAGYWNHSFANMTAVRAYAASQGARTFSYTPNGDPGADALDMEPGDASPSAFPAFYKAKGGVGVHGYGSASWVDQIVAAASAAGIARSSYKIISAHYIGPHICAPDICGYPQADATQFTDTYLGRSLDATLCSASFFGATPAPSPGTKYQVTALPPGHWKGQVTLIGTVGGKKWYTATADGSDWTPTLGTEPHMAYPNSVFYVTALPPGWWEGTIVLGGNGTDNNRWHTSSANGSTWNSPKRT